MEMELTVNTYGAYLHVRDGMFEVSVRDLKTKEVKKFDPIAAHKVKTLILAPGTSLSSDV